jgi:transcriptional regulator with XRE-family HTH domain
MGSQRLKEVRKSLGLTQSQLGEKLDIPWHRIKDIESGKQKVSPDLAERLEEIFSINGWWLLTGNGQMSLLPPPFPEKDEQHIPKKLGYGFGAPKEEIVLAKDTFFEEFAREIEFFKGIQFPKQTIIRLLESAIKHLQTKSVDSVKTTDESNDKILLGESLFDFITEITKDSHMTMPKQLLTELTDTLLQEAIKRRGELKKKD